VPTFGGLFIETPNFEPANPISTPAEIAPVWYFTPFYAILRAVPDPQIGALLMLLSIVIWFFVPWLDRSPVKSIRYRSLAVQAVPGCLRGVVPGADVPGMKPAENIYVTLARIFMAAISPSSC
jgi:ubiquinol-cytochrome c reductase cytochrome b subunit